MSKKVPSKASKKSWEGFARWLRSKNAVTVKDFDSNCEWKLLIGEESDKTHAKSNEEECAVRRKADESNRQGACEFERNCVDIEESAEGVVGVLVSNKLRIADEKKDFSRSNDVEASEKNLGKEVRRAMEKKEAIVATGVPVLSGETAGTQALQDHWECVEDKGSSGSRKRNKSTPLASEAAILLALASVVESSARGCEEGKIKMRVDCEKVWEWLLQTG